jgi:hypothetical protein
MFGWFKRNRSGGGREAAEQWADNYERQLLKSGVRKIYPILKQPPNQDQPGSWSYRISAANALWHFPSIETAEVLYKTITTDPEYLVRYAAVKSYLLIYGYSWDEANEQMKALAPKLGYKKPAPDAAGLETLQQLVCGRIIGLAPGLK